MATNLRSHAHRASSSRPSKRRPTLRERHSASNHHSAPALGSNSQREGCTYTNEYACWHARPRASCIHAHVHTRGLKPCLCRETAYVCMHSVQRLYLRAPSLILPLHVCNMCTVSTTCAHCTPPMHSVYGLHSGERGCAQCLQVVQEVYHSMRSAGSALICGLRKWLLCRSSGGGPM